MRYFTVLILALAFAAPAQASYLHVARARRAATHLLAHERTATLGGCWHTSARVAQCSYKLTDVCIYGASCEITATPLADGTLAITVLSRGLVTVTLRHGVINAHT